MEKYEEIRAKCRRELLETIDYTRDMDDEEILDNIDRKVLKAGREYYLTLEEGGVSKSAFCLYPQTGYFGGVPGG